MQTTTTEHSSPTVRLHQSSPSPRANNQPMLAQAPFMGGGWNEYNGGYLSALPKTFKDQRYHKRASSGSSAASAGPPSPLSQNTVYPHIATSDSNFSPSFDFEYSTPQTAAKSLPSATETAMMFSRANGYGPVDMRRIQSSGNDERASYSMSAPQSVSTMSHNSPATPQTGYESEYDESKHLYGFNSAAYQQSLQDVFPDQQFNYQPQIQRMAAQPHRATMMADRLQAANNDHLRTNSPTSNPRDLSPFRQNSPYGMPAPLQRPQPMPSLQKTRTSISPKELMLDENDLEDGSSTPLFPDQQQTYSRRKPSNLSNFYVPTFNNEPTIQIPQQYPFVNRRESSGLPDSTPDFPAHLMSMESTVEEPSSQSSVPEAKPQKSPLSRRPVDTSSDAGTYSCTYHGCSLRFDTPSKLQKHKREGHRQASPTGSTTSPSQAIRNSQAGPHRCDRINPSTGKPCNSIFSRPYDLTRHEDTIHNGRKQKVRCHLCTEEKTFSRNDALTRHMRVVHPDVDWVGKQKRKTQK